jgi:hypothetical protein
MSRNLTLKNEVVIIYNERDHTVQSNGPFQAQIMKPALHRISKRAQGFKAVPLLT